MKKISILLVLFILVSFQSQAREIYVNGAFGNDTLAAFTGSSESTAYKTINNAIMKSAPGDNIFVEGRLNDTTKIIYSESVVIPGNLQRLKIIGVNDPVIDGKFQAEDSIPKAGFNIRANIITIRGFIIRNFININVDSKGFFGSAGIYSSNNARIEILDNLIEKCNYGVVFIDAEFCSIQNNKINSSIAVIKDGEFNKGGIGVGIYALDNTIQKIMIGNETGNQFNNNQLHGVFIGKSNAGVLADFTEIQNNSFTGTQDASALVLMNLEGMVKVERNVFDTNYAALYVEGLCLDTWIAENKFLGSKSDQELIADVSYDPQIFYDLWKNNDNEFPEGTYAIVDNRKRVTDTDSFRYIWNNREKASANLKDGFVLEDNNGK